MKREEITSFSATEFGVVDVIAIERQARAMQAQVIADLLRTGWRRVSGWLNRTPDGQTA
jgi:hypothetical protein